VIGSVTFAASPAMNTLGLYAALRHFLPRNSARGTTLARLQVDEIDEHTAAIGCRDGEPQADNGIRRRAGRDAVLAAKDDRTALAWTTGHDRRA
jgi:hypothetical protein